MVIVTTNPADYDVNMVVDHIVHVCHSTPSLTPRSSKTLKTIATHRNLVVALNGGSPIGWIACEQLRRGVYELGMAYIEPVHRKTGLLEQMLDQLINPAHTYLFATYSPSIYARMQQNYGFAPARLNTVLRVSHGAFAVKRLGTAHHVATHMQQRPPLYGLRKAKK